MSEHVETNPRSYVYTSFSNTFLRQMQTMTDVKLSITRGHGNDIRYCPAFWDCEQIPLN